MAKRKTTGYMTAGEQIAGTVLFVVYLLVLPLVWEPLFRWLERLLAAGISQPVRNAIYYYGLLLAVAIIFHRFLAVTSSRLGDHPGDAVKGTFGGLVVLYGLNELASRLAGVFFRSGVNLNDAAVTAQVHDAPQTMRIILILVAPLIEEVLFRGLVFGNLKDHNRWGAYLLSAGLYALFPVWRFVAADWSGAALAVAVQYLIPGLVLAGTYEYAGTLWTPFAVHALANALAIWTGRI